MADLNFSLDDFIKKKQIKFGNFRGKNTGSNVRRGGGSIKRMSDAPRSTNIDKFPRYRRNLIGRGGVVTDARLKIQQKMQIPDAREKLRDRAMKTDARFRLEQMRRMGTKPEDTRPTIRDSMLQMRVQGHSFENELLMDLDDLGNKMAGMTRGGFVDSFGPTHNQPLLYRTVENELPFQRQDLHSWYARNDSSPIKIDYSPEGGRISQSGSSWREGNVPLIITRKLKPIKTVGILKSSDSGRPRTLSERFSDDDDAAALKVRQINARLDVLQNDIGRTAPRELPREIGHRIVVSNLVSSVSHEDVKELFEDIGELLLSKVVRPGTAEVVYKKHEDAVKAVDVYHNRQLDGQPMKCLLVNSKNTEFTRSSEARRGGGGGGGKPAIKMDMYAFRKALHTKSAF